PPVRQSPVSQARPLLSARAQLARVPAAACSAAPAISVSAAADSAASPSLHALARPARSAYAAADRAAPGPARGRMPARLVILSSQAWTKDERRTTKGCGFA